MWYRILWWKNHWVGSSETDSVEFIPNKLDTFEWLFSFLGIFCISEIKKLDLIITQLFSNSIKCHEHPFPENV